MFRFAGLVSLLILLAMSCFGNTATASAAEFAELVPQLNTKSFKEKTALIEQLAASDDERIRSLFEALLDNRLYVEKNSGKVLIVDNRDDGFAAIELISQQDRGVLNKKDLKKVSTNNKLRKMIRTVIAELSLSHPDRAVRLEAVKQLLPAAKAQTAALMLGYIENERDADVLALMQLIVSLNDLQSNNVDTQLAAIKNLSRRLEPEVRNRLAPLVEGSNQEVAKAASKALERIESKVKLFEHIKTVFFGLSLGSVLVLAAIGLAITFGVMGVINMAHGELIMLGAYTAYTMQQLMPNFIGASLLLSIPVAFLVSALVGILIERVVIRHLYGRPLETLLATFGISLILQ